MNTKDKLILNVLKENSKLSVQKISKETNIPVTTVYNRIKNLEKNKIIKKYTILLDNKLLDKNIAAYVAITMDYSLLKKMNLSQHDIAKKLKRNENVEEIAMITGIIDILIKIRVKDIEELDNFVTKYLRNIDGIKKTQTMVVLNEVE